MLSLRPSGNKLTQVLSSCVKCVYYSRQSSLLGMICQYFNFIHNLCAYFQVQRLWLLFWFPFQKLDLMTIQNNSFGRSMIITQEFLNNYKHFISKFSVIGFVSLVADLHVWAWRTNSYLVFEQDVLRIVWLGLVMAKHICKISMERFLKEIEPM